MIARIRRATRGDEGASAVEFALVLPILLLVVFGMVAVGFALFAQITAQQTAREAARVAAVGGFTGCSIAPTGTPNDAYLTNFITTRQVSTPTIVKLRLIDGTDSGTTIEPGDRVEISYSFPTNSIANGALTGITSAIPGGSILMPNTLTVKADSRIEVVGSVTTCG